MDLQTSLIDLDSIETIEENNFSVDPVKQASEIQMLAKTVVNIQGLLRIPVVEQIGIESYKLISGHFDYYAYLKARELDSSLPDRIRVFIVNPKKQIAKGILEQLEAIDRLQVPIIDSDDSSLKLLKQLSNTVNFEILERLSQLEKQVLSVSTTEILKQLEHSLKEAIIGITKVEEISESNEIIQRILQIEEKLAEIKNTIAHSVRDVTPIVTPDPELGRNLISELFSNLASGSLEVVIRKPQQEQQQKAETIDLSSHVTPLKILNELSREKLIQTIQKAGISNKITQTITANFLKARSEAPFTSYTDVVVRTKELSDKRMLQILDSLTGLS